MAYIASVTIRLNEPKERAYRADVYSDDEAAVTNRIVHVPPVENDVSRYRGSYATREAAEAAIRSAFPQARRSR